MRKSNIVRVRDVMKPEYDIVDGMTTVMDALETMKHVEANCLIVEKRHEDDEYGMLLISDIARHVLAMDRAPNRVNVYEIMVKPVLSVHPDMDIRYCARLFDKFDLTRAPVIEDGKVVGIVGFTDLVIRGMGERG